MFIPARLRSNGRHGDGSMSRSPLKPLNVSLASASVPPASTASARPRRIASAPWPIAIVLDEHAATTQDRGPSKPNRSAITSTGVLEKWFHASDGRARSMPAVIHVL